ncbi:phosphomannomutase/phosphoglucomutase [Patescibacteria group bacterium]|nr:phosphomannomutase/phosphoglucomutase [Patescibacteria group bacterium]
MQINPKIFKAYDIRGVYPEEINEEAVYQIGQAFIEFLNSQGEAGNRQFVVARDARFSSDNLAEVLIQSLISSSCDVIDIGRASTPLFYWAIIKEKAAGGIIITASHNPAQFNGLKFCKQGAETIDYETGLFKIREIALRNQFFTVSPSTGKAIQKNLLSEYVGFLKEKSDLGAIKPLKIIIDCGNGIMGPEIIELFKELPCQTEILFGEPDGDFPNHEANPLKEENLIALRERILAGAADLGIAFDGDGDRIGFLDEKGEVVRGDFITVLIAAELLKQNPGEKIFYEIRSSRVVPEVVRENGGQPILGRAGHSLIKNQMRRENILFGGELSGHYFFRDMGFTDNALAAMLEILKILSREQKAFSQVAQPLKRYYLSGEINFTVSDPDKKIEDIESRYSGAEIKKIDGITVEYPDWWFNLRKSNTEPLVRLNIEANSPELLKKKKKELFNLLEKK